MSLTFRTERGAGFSSILDELGELRIRVFREWPYLYEGNLDYERTYLKTYLQSPTSFGFFAFDGDKLVGATTAMELQDELLAFQQPFIQQSFDVNKVVYFGESILLPEYRGKGLGKRFMQERLSYARSFGDKEFAAFCAVARPSDHPLRPASYKPLDQFWLASGFTPCEDMVASFKWKDLDKKHDDQKILQFWLQPLKEKQ